MSQPSTAVTGKYDELLATCRALSPLAAAIAWPCEESALKAAVEAAEAGLIRPVLVGPTDSIRALADRLGIAVGAYALVEAPSSHAAAAKAVQLVRSAEAEILMKGSLHSDAFLVAAMEPETGLRTDRRLSHVFLMDVPTYHKGLVITDAVVAHPLGRAVASEALSRLLERSQRRRGADGHGSPYSGVDWAGAAW